MALMALLMIACCATAQHAGQPETEQTKIQNVEKELLGMWQMVRKYNGHTFYGQEFKVYTADHQWYNFRINMPKPGKYAGGTWKVTAPDTIVERNTYSIDNNYDGGTDVHLTINTLKPTFHGISFIPEGFNSRIYMYYEKVMEKSAGNFGFLMGRDEKHFENIENHPYMSDKIRFHKNQGNTKEQIELAQMPAATTELLKDIAGRLLLGKQCRMILRIAINQDGELAVHIPQRTLFGDNNSCFITVYHKNEDADAAETLFKQVSSLSHRTIEKNAVYYTIEIPVTSTEGNANNPAGRLDMTNGITL